MVYKIVSTLQTNIKICHNCFLAFLILSASFLQPSWISAETWQSLLSYVIYRHSCLPIALNYVRLRIGCLGSLMSLYIGAHTSGYSYRCMYIVFQCKLNISCIMFCGNKLILTCIMGWWIIIALLYIRVDARWKKDLNYNRCIMVTMETEEIVCLHSEATARNMKPWRERLCINLNNNNIEIRWK